MVGITFDLDDPVTGNINDDAALVSANFAVTALRDNLFAHDSPPDRLCNPDSWSLSFRWGCVATGHALPS
jgi:hypothetical protein